jgi:diketogulonate reductase-like aldo/keto reductase
LQEKIVLKNMNEIQSSKQPVQIQIQWHCNADTSANANASTRKKIKQNMPNPPHKGQQSKIMQTKTPNSFAKMIARKCKTNKKKNNNRNSRETKKERKVIKAPGLEARRGFQGK